MFTALAADDSSEVKNLLSADLANRIRHETDFARWIQSYRGHTLVSIDGPPSIGPKREWGAKATLLATWTKRDGKRTVEQSGEIKLRSPDGKTWYWDDF